MIEIEREEKSVGGRWGWFVRGRPEIKGRSRQPLLDACRTLKAMGEDPLAEIYLLRPGSTEWDLRTTVGYGAGKTVREDVKRGPELANYQPFESFE